MSDLQILTDMGFSPERAARALEVTNNKGVEPAMEWLLAHVDEAIPNMNDMANAPVDANLATSSEAAATVPISQSQDSSNSSDNPIPTSSSQDQSAAAAAAEAKSFKCNECNRLFKTQLEIEFHAAKSGHNDFSESTEEKKPLSEEEKKDQLTRLEEKLKQKRMEREANEKLEALEKEKLRIKSGKDLSEARRKLEEIEMQKIVEQRKREKQEEKAARERVKAQIEADKMARKARIAAELGQTVAATPPPPIQEVTVPATAKSTANYSKTKIQVRLQDGSTLCESFDAKESLSAVRLFIQLKRGDSETPFSLMTSFPRKIFTDDDYEKPLDILGLVPSAVVIVTKK